MKMLEVKVKNFKRLHNFHLNLVDGNPNLVLVNGTNGNGKTSLLNAFEWAFFSRKPKPNEFAKAELVNLKVGDSSSIEVEVKLALNNSGEIAVIRRVQDVNVFDPNIEFAVEFTHPEDLTIAISHADLATPTEIVANPHLWLEEMLPQRFKSFILFNGEEMFTFFTTNVKGAIEDAIREIAKVDFFEECVDGVSDQLQRIQQKMAKLAGPTAEKIEADRVKAEEELGGYAREIKRIRGDKEATEAEIKRLEVLLDGRKDSGKYLEQNKQYREDLDRQIYRKSQADAQISKALFSSGVGHFLLARTKYPLERQIKEAVAAKKYPADYRPEAIEKLISDGVCICGTHLGSDSEGVRHLKQILQMNLDAGEIGLELQKIQLGMASFEGKTTEANKTVQTSLEMLTDANREIERIRNKIAELEPHLEGVDASSSDLMDITRAHKRLNNDLTDLARDESILLAKAQRAKDEAETLQKKFEKAMVNSSLSGALTYQANFLSRALEQAREFAGEIIANVRNQLEQELTKGFKKVDGCQNFSTVVTEEFDIYAVDNRGVRTELSSGQEMALAYLFSIALRDVVGLNFPLVVDTPFGRLNNNNRAMLTDALGDLTRNSADNDESRQVVMMMHDAEYTPYAKRNFAKFNPRETFLKLSRDLADVEKDAKESTLEEGIDPAWLTVEAWKDWAEGNIKL